MHNCIIKETTFFLQQTIMRTLNTIFTALLLLSITFACKHTEEPKSEIVVAEESKEVLTSGITFDSGVDSESQSSQEVQTKTFSFKATDNWSASISETKATTWITLDPASGGAGDVTIAITVQPNTGEEDRTVTITIVCGDVTITFTVTQEGVEANTSNYLTFISSGSTNISFAVRNMFQYGAQVYTPVLYYSYDKENWEQWDFSSLAFSVSMPLYMYGDNLTGLGSLEFYSYCSFISEGDPFSIEGNLMSLLSPDRELLQVPAWGFQFLFEGCHGLTKAPDLPATKLSYRCYAGLFEGCSLLSYIKCLATYTKMPLPVDPEHVDHSQPPVKILAGWVDGVSDTGTFVCASGMSSVWTRGVGGIPEGWTVEEFGTPVTGISLDKQKIQLESGESTTLSATIFPADAINKEVLWTSQNEDVATVDDFGHVTGHRGGTAIINAVSLDGGYIAGCAVTVPDIPVTGVVLDKSEWHLQEGYGSFTLSATVSPEYATNKSVTWISSNPSVATVDSEGKVTAIKEGTTEITATTEEGQYTDICVVYVFGKVTNYLTLVSSGCSFIQISDHYPSHQTNYPAVYYSYDKALWLQLNLNERLTIISDKPLYLSGDNPMGLNLHHFVSDGDDFSIVGDIMSLINYRERVTSVPKNCFCELFAGCTNLTTAPELPATILAQGCYSNMFNGCTGLTTAPELPATILAQGCYRSMFSGCTGLTTAPELPATSLAPYCYNRMFDGCSSLEFVNCRATDISAQACTLRWLDGVQERGTFFRNPENSSWSIGPSGIPEGWNIQPAI